MSRVGYPKHDPEAPECGCWACDNDRKVKAMLARRAEDRERALQGAADLVVTYTKDGDKYRMEHGGYVIEGTLRQLLLETTAFEQTLIDVFLGLPLLERALVLDKAKRAGRIRVGDMVFDTDEEGKR